MADRIVVASLARTAKGSISSVRVCPDLLAELCRAWLALDAAPVFDIHLVHDGSGRCIAANFATRSDPGQRVRLVATHSAGGE